MMPFTEECRTGEFEASLCGCCSDCESCCYAYCCYNAAKATAWAEVRGESTRCCHCWNYGLFIKANIRHIRGMEESLCCDCCAYMCCPCCALSQDLRELKKIKATCKQTWSQQSRGNFSTPQFRDHGMDSSNSGFSSNSGYGAPSNFAYGRNEVPMHDITLNKPLIYPNNNPYA
ncbi:hypothetical protein TRFO_16428 [Tritrichomonas foetus]|uniref:Uncharacterized protein n=1 Tax=Tritrichomonas foetus TaxID=1144522 RepID=A0A1J4KR83_9EUKA|nr:hypothetical protein TRFO_16428 [Tritrichomonas foetus]|eukprot:OHT13440.1 hypothetical protein TRFO_16428 [Tritrichomonas foetus]